MKSSILICCLNAGYLYSTIEGYCSGKNEWLENASCLSAWKKDGDCFCLLVIDKFLTLALVLTRYFNQVEMTGDYTPDMMALMSADIIISTPEKWDGISRNWHSRSYVTKVHICCYFSNRICFSFIFVHFIDITILNC